MFHILGARLAAVRRVDLELDRVLANRFNPLDYLRTDELGLSHIIADLLDPSATHGQGVVFLARFLQRIGKKNSDVLPGGEIPRLGTASVDTRCERPIDGERRLDISIEISPGDSQPLCIAIENKPYAADGEGQVDAYLQFLRSHYPKRFLLIYLSPHGGLPSSESLPPDASKDGLATLSYCQPTHSSGYWNTTLQLDFALTDWLRECSLSCAVDRLRWFLRDTENFCHKTFGGILTSDKERQEIQDFILESKANLLSAFAVLDAYPNARDEVIYGFLERLHGHIAQELKQEGLETGWDFADKPREDGVWVYRSSWEGDDATPYTWLGHDRTNASSWWLGVGFYPTGSKDPRIEKLRKPLAKDLKRPSHSRSDNFSWWRYLDQHRDWAPLLVQLNNERQHPGELIEHFTTKFVAFAQKAINVIDREIDGE